MAAYEAVFLFGIGNKGNMDKRTIAARIIIEIRR